MQYFADKSWFHIRFAMKRLAVITHVCVFSQPLTPTDDWIWGMDLSSHPMIWMDELTFHCSIRKNLFQWYLLITVTRNWLHYIAQHMDTVYQWHFNIEAMISFYACIHASIIRHIDAILRIAVHFEILSHRPSVQRPLTQDEWEEMVFVWRQCMLFSLPAILTFLDYIAL